MANISKKTKEAFANAETLAELKSAYVDAMHKYVAPKNIEQVDGLYIKYFDEVKTWNKTKTGEMYEKATDEVCSFFLNAVHTLNEVEGVEYEMVGTWLWVMDAEGHEGTTKDMRDTLKSCGTHYAPNKQMWYIAPKNSRRSRKHYTYAEIKAMHGEDEV